MKRKLDHNELALWIQLVADLTGIALTDDKEYLIRERFHNLLDKYHCSSYSQLYFIACDETRSDIREDIIDQITTKETSFFRDSAPFEALRAEILPRLLRQCRLSSEKRPLRIWSAACSTGQEAYSVAMILQELGASPLEYRITATDISRSAVEAAQRGCYSRFEVDRGVPPHLLQRFFLSTPNSWQILDTLKASLCFKRLNLNRPFQLPEKFDLIICRNVAIYFSRRDRETLFVQLHRHLRADGCLMIGSTETARDFDSLFKECESGGRSLFLKPC